MRKRLFLAALAAIVGTATAIAQQIAVVSEGGSTNVFQTLTEAIEGASDGSVIYLPGGGFQIDDSVKITKKLTIIGIGHKAKNENVDGNTTIAGNLNINASKSSVMGCYISGNIYINEGGNNVTVKYCNVNEIHWPASSTGTVINQNYIRTGCYGNSGSAEFTNNITQWVRDLDGGRIENNIFTGYYKDTYYGYAPLSLCDNCTITNNIFLNNQYIGCGSNCLVYGNMRLNGDWGDDPINIAIDSWDEVFTNYNNGAITPASDFHFTADYQKYSDCGIYGGTGFSDGALPPVPFIVAKSIPEQTDASGNLNIKIRVKASE
jgi:hypothetical protein